MINATRSDKNLVIDILTKSFDINQSVNYIVKQDSKRIKRIEALMDYSFEVCYLFGEVLLSDDKKACALKTYLDKKKTTLKSIMLDMKFVELPELGKVVLFRLMNNGKIRSDLIYIGKDKEILRFTKEAFVDDIYYEKDLINVQREFFNRIKDELHFATHSLNKESEESYFLKDIQEFQFKKIGKFQLIDEKFYGQTNQYFVPNDNDDDKFEVLLNLQNKISEMFRQKELNKDQIRLKKKMIERHFKKMAGQILSVRLKNTNYTPLLGNEKDYFEIYKIASTSYTFEFGVDLRGESCIL